MFVCVCVCLCVCVRVYVSHIYMSCNDFQNSQRVKDLDNMQSGLCLLLCGSTPKALPYSLNQATIDDIANNFNGEVVSGTYNGTQIIWKRTDQFTPQPFQETVVIFM